jgi:hypothetical protein
MKRVLEGSLLLLLLLPMAAFSQKKGNGVENLKEFDYKRLRFGFSIGFNQMDFDIMQADRFNRLDSIYSIESSRKVGFTLGPLASFKLHDFIDIRAFILLSFGQRNLSYTYAQSTANNKPPYDTKSMIIESTFVEFPLQFKINGRRYGNVRPYLIGGTSLKYDWASQKKIKEAELPKIRLKPFDLYYEAGMGMEYYFPYFKLSSELKFAFGTSNIIKPDGSQYTTSVKTMYSKMVVLLFHFQ